MGVSLYAYQHLGEPIRVGPIDWAEAKDEAFAEMHLMHGAVHLYNLDDFQDRGDGVAEGLYNVSGDTHSFSMSYGSYNVLREHVCQAAMGVEPRAVWNDPDRYSHFPMYELVHFADNEGFLGPQTCRRLLEDVAAIRDTSTWGDWFQTCWQDLVICLTVAAGDGVIVYS